MYNMYTSAPNVTQTHIPKIWWHFHRPIKWRIPLQRCAFFAQANFSHFLNKITIYMSSSCLLTHAAYIIVNNFCLTFTAIVITRFPQSDTCSLAHQSNFQFPNRIWFSLTTEIVCIVPIVQNDQWPLQAHDKFVHNTRQTIPYGVDTRIMSSLQRFEWFKWGYLKIRHLDSIWFE